MTRRLFTSAFLILVAIAGWSTGPFPRSTASASMAQAGVPATAVYSGGSNGSHHQYACGLTRYVTAQCREAKPEREGLTGTPGYAPVRGTDDGLLLTAADVAGYSVSTTGPSVGRAAVGGKIPKSLSRVRATGIAFKAGKRRLTVGVFTFAKSSGAIAALKAFALGRKRVSVGAGGWLRNVSTKKVTDVAVVFRVSSALGAVRFQSSGRVPGAVAIDEAYGQMLVSRLSRVLALTAWQRTLDGIRSDGSIDRTLALQAFTLAYGPLPGVQRPSGNGGAPPSATLAMQLVARVWNQLSRVQQLAIDRYLGAPHDAKSNQRARKASQILTPDAHYQALADKYNAIYHARIPGLPVITIRAFRASEDITVGDKGAKAFMDALAVNSQGEWGVGAPAYCRVRVPPFGRAQSKQFQELTVAHETFHCVEFVLMANWRHRTDWIIEGMADWAAVTADPVPGQIGGGNYLWYLATPKTPLFARSYDAVGFWGHADEAGGKGSLWAKIPAILGAPTDPASYSLAGGKNSAFVDTWASAAWRLLDAGSAWNQTDPYVLPFKAYPAFPVAYIGGNDSLASEPYALAEYGVAPDPGRPLVEVLSAHGTLRAGTFKEDFGPVTSEWFCLGKCKCPPGDKSSIPSNRQTGPILDLALTGGEGAGSGVVRYHSLDEFCQQQVTGRGIYLFQSSVGGGTKIAAVFKTATCKKIRTKQKDIHFLAVSSAGPYELRANIEPFTGFHTYYMEFRATNPTFTVDGPGGHFSNIYWPGGTPPNHPGQITFSADGKIMGLGFLQAWNTDFSDAITLAGTVPCKYSK